jgi:hypothetical protein
MNGLKAKALSFWQLANRAKVEISNKAQSQKKWLRTKKLSLQTYTRWAKVSVLEKAKSFGKVLGRTCILQWFPLKFIIMRRKYIIYFMIFVSIALFPASAYYQKTSVTNYKRAIVRQIQVLLSQKGINPGRIDGRCGPDTNRALKEYKDTLTGDVKQYFSALCQDIDKATLQTINNDTRLSLHHKEKYQQQDQTVNLKKLEEDLISTNMTVRNLSERFSDSFAAQFKDIASLGVTTTITAISIIIAFAALLGNLIIKDAVKDAHDKEIEKARSKLEDLTQDVRANIFTTVSAHNIYFYREIDPLDDRRKDVYKSHVLVATKIAKRAYQFSNALKKNRSLQ